MGKLTFEVLQKDSQRKQLAEVLLATRPYSIKTCF